MAEGGCMVQAACVPLTGSLCLEPTKYFEEKTGSFSRLNALSHFISLCEILQVNIIAGKSSNAGELQDFLLWSSFRILSALSSSHCWLGLQVSKENKKEKSEIIKEAAPNNLKHRHQSDDETVEENKMQKIEYVTYHRGHGAQGVPKLVIRSPGLSKENKKEKSEIIKEAALALEVVRSCLFDDLWSAVRRLCRRIRCRR